MGAESRTAQGVATGSISGNEDESTVAGTERTLTQESFNPANFKVEKGKKSGGIARLFRKTWVKVVSLVGAAIIVFLSGLGVGMVIHSGGGHPHMPPGQGRQMAPGEQMDRQMRPGGPNRQLPPGESNQNGQNPRNLDNQNQNGNNQNDSQQQSGNNQSPQNGEKPGEQNSSQNGGANSSNS